MKSYIQYSFLLISGATLIIPTPIAPAAEIPLNHLKKPQPYKDWPIERIVDETQKKDGEIIDNIKEYFKENNYSKDSQLEILNKPVSRNYFGDTTTLLHLAIETKKPKVVEWLLENGADPTICETEGHGFRTKNGEFVTSKFCYHTLFHALDKRDWKSVDYLLKALPENTVNTLTTDDVASINNPYNKPLPYLLKSFNRFRTSTEPDYDSFNPNYLNTLQVLVDHGADPHLIIKDSTLEKKILNEETSPFLMALFLRPHDYPSIWFKPAHYMFKKTLDDNSRIFEFNPNYTNKIIKVLKNENASTINQYNKIIFENTPTRSEEKIAEMQKHLQIFKDQINMWIDILESQQTSSSDSTGHA